MVEKAGRGGAGGCWPRCRSRAVDPRFGWVGGVLAILASVALAVGFLATLDYPEPVLGG